MYGSVTESAANTLTFGEIQTNVSVFDKAAFVLHRLEWHIPANSFDKLVDAADSMEFALVTSQNISSLGIGNPAVIDKLIIALSYDSAVGFAVNEIPLIRDFSTLPGGGLIVAPRPLFLACRGVSLASALSVELLAYFTVKTLSADEYLELVDFYRIVGV